jgi:hypothetical protein
VLGDGIFEHRDVENNRRQWQDGVARARDELGAERFAELVAVGASLSDEEAVAFLSENHPDGRFQRRFSAPADYRR